MYLKIKTLEVLFYQIGVGQDNDRYKILYPKNKRILLMEVKFKDIYKF